MAGEGSLKLTPSAEACRESVLKTIAAAVESWGSREGWGSNLVFRVNLVLDELNIAYGREEGRRSPDIVIEMASREAKWREVSDDGRPFNPLRSPPAPAIHENLEAAPVGGLGIHLVKNGGQQSYRHEDGRNRVTMPRGGSNPGREPASSPDTDKPNVRGSPP